jgi:hypothetical protein
MDMQNSQKREWSKPTLVQNPIEQTQAGAGSNTDGLGGEGPIPTS